MKRPTPPPPAPSPRRHRLLGIALGTVFALALALAAALSWRGATVSAAAPDGVLECRGFPQFTRQYGFTGGIVISTANRERSGLVLHDPAQPSRGFQHPNGTWDDAGDLGPFAVDRQGMIYVAPVPRTDLLRNPPAKATTIWRVDTESGEMRPFATIEAAAPPSERNPFGVVGLAYDCTTNSLYAASLAGSAPREERGRLVRLDLTSGKQSVVLDGVDALNVAVANTPSGKRLYYGLARSGELWSLGLDDAGGARGEARLEADQALLGTTSEEKVRRITISQGTMELAVVPFAFTLQARSDSLQRQITLRYDAATQRWRRE